MEAPIPPPPEFTKPNTEQVARWSTEKSSAGNPVLLPGEMGTMQAREWNQNGQRVSFTDTLSSHSGPGVALLQCEGDDGKLRHLVMEKGVVIDITASKGSHSIVAVDTLSNDPQTAAKYAGEKWLRVGERISPSPDAPRLTKVLKTEGKVDANGSTPPGAQNPFDGLGDALSQSIPDFNTRLSVLAGPDRSFTFMDMGKPK